jgi:hypothetical protein
MKARLLAQRRRYVYIFQVFASSTQLGLRWLDVGISCVKIVQLLKEYQMVFRAGQRDPCTRDVAKNHA